MPRFNYDPQVTLIKRHNADVFRETTSIIKAGYYITPSGKRIDLDMQPMIDGGRCYHKDLGPVDAPKLGNGSLVRVEKGDCLKVAEQLVKEGYNPALLNFASAGHPGGGVETGARAQEETICRRSTLTRSIFSFDGKYAARYGYEHQLPHLPLTRLQCDLFTSSHGFPRSGSRLYADGGAFPNRRHHQCRTQHERQVPHPSHSRRTHP